MAGDVSVELVPQDLPAGAVAEWTKRRGVAVERVVLDCPVIHGMPHVKQLAVVRRDQVLLEEQAVRVQGVRSAELNGPGIVPWVNAGALQDAVAHREVVGIGGRIELSALQVREGEPIERDASGAEVERPESRPRDDGLRSGTTVPRVRADLRALQRQVVFVDVRAANRVGPCGDYNCVTGARGRDCSLNGRIVARHVDRRGWGVSLRESLPARLILPWSLCPDGPAWVEGKGKQRQEDD